MDDEQRRLDDLDDEHDDEDDGTRGIWAAFEREAGPAIEQPEVNIDSLKERLKRGARLRAGRTEDEMG
jgi:hypothetical protein